MMAGTIKRTEYFSATTDPHTSWINKAHGCNLICKVGKEQRTKNNKDTAVEKHGTGCDKNYFNASNERTMISGE
jgi:hypothetical protein